MSAMPAAAIQAAFLAACRAELEALKPGNVHVHADGHRMTVADFLTSAAVSAPLIAAAGRGVGARILAAVAATRAARGQNTNLGILLLAAPLAAAAERPPPLGAGLAAVLAALTVEDTSLTYHAIRLASPAGLGSSGQHDVTDEPTVTLLEAMRTASDRDLIARQYATGYADVFGIGVARLQACRAAGWSDPWATSATYLAFLAAFPDTHVARKHGADRAREVQRHAAALEARLRSAADPAALQPLLLDVDRELKDAGVNPGTSADLTVASHFAAALLA
jgi:triphosphoribosyl-dephospho-CoA synthase